MAQIPMAAAAREVLPELDIFPPERQRRWTVLLRALLAIPQLIAVAVLAIAAIVVTIIGWFGALALGRLPAWCAEFLAGYLRYETRVTAYLHLLVDTYPPFEWSPEHYPVSVQLAPGRLNRVAVLFRLILYIPVWFMTQFLGFGWTILAVFFWLTVLILGRMPRPVFEATAAVLRYTMRAQAYVTMLTSAYPKWLFGDRWLVAGEYPALPPLEGYPPPASDPDWQQPVPPPRSSTRPLLLSPGGRALLIVIIVLGVLGYLGQNIGPRMLQNRDLDNGGTFGPNQVAVTLHGYHTALNDGNGAQTYSYLTGDLR